jgi:hypothetical protein
MNHRIVSVRVIRRYTSLLFALLCASGMLSPAFAQSTNYSRRFGGSDGDFPTAVTSDTFGTYITGYTYSTNFPGAPPRVGAAPNDADVFVTKLNDAGEIVWSVVIGGTGLDSPAAIAPDSVGNVYIAGRTTSTNFPTTSALQSSPSGNGDAFVFKLNLVGDVQYSTYLGGSGFDAATAIAVNTNTFEAIVVGATAGNLNINSDVFITRLGPNGTNVTLSTFLRGSDFDSPSAVVLDQFNDIYVAGSTRSLDFPATPNAYRTEMSFSNVGEAFVTKLNRNTGAIVYSTFLARPTAAPLALVVDSGEAAYIAGAEQFSVFGSPGAPTAPGAPRPPPSVAWNSNAAFLVRLAPSGSQLQYAQKYDTSGQDSIRALGLDFGLPLRPAGALGEHLFTGVAGDTIRPFAACGDESVHLFAFSGDRIYHLAGFGPTSARPPGVPVSSAFFQDRREADILVNAYSTPPGPGGDPVAGLSLLNTYEDRFSSNEVIYVRVDGGEVDSQLASITVLSGTNAIATYDRVPQLLALTNLPSGLYNLTAVALNTAGARGTSCPLSFTVSPAPVNDSFYRAAHIEGTSYVTNATTAGASAEATEPATSSFYFGTPRRSVWWCWTAPASGPFAVEASSDEISPEVAVFTGPNLSQLERIAGSGPGSNVVSVFKATAGTHYFFSVDSAYSGDFVFRLRPAQPPPNDDHTNRIAIMGANVTVTGDNIDATREPALSFDAAESPASVWWRWTAPATGQYLALVTSSTFSPALDVQSVTNPGFGLPGVGQLRVSFSATAGEEFDFRIAGMNGSMGHFTLSISNIVSPANDNFAAATPITSLPASVPGTTLGATIEPNEPGDATASVWYRWTATSNVVLTAEINPPYVAAIQVFSGTALSNLVVVGGEFGSRTVSFRAESGKQYFIRLDDYSGGTSGFTLTLRAGRSPSNDDFANAIMLSGFPLSIIGSNSEASLEPGEPSHFEESVWYRWVAPSNGHYVLAIEGANQSFLVTPYTGTALSNLARATIASPAPEQNFTTRFFGNAGTEYYLAVSGYEGSGDLFRLKIRSAAPPANDNFANRATLTSFHTISSTVDASIESGEPLDDSFADGSVWWSWTAPESRRMIVWLTNMSESLQFQVFTGTTLSGLSLVGSAFGSSGLVVDAQAGQTYAIQVAGRGQGTFTLNLAAILQPPNDHFTNAFTLTGINASATGIGLGATREPGEPSYHFNNDGSVWWNWTAPASGRVSVFFSGTFLQQPLIVYAGNSVNSLTNVSDPLSFRRTPATFLARAGETYRIAVYSPSVQPFQISLVAPAPPPNPQLESMRRLANGSFEFQFDAITGQTNVIDASTDLLNWTPISTNSLDCGVLTVLDPSAGSFPHRFYRLRAQ